MFRKKIKQHFQMRTVHQGSGLLPEIPRASVIEVSCRVRSQLDSCSGRGWGGQVHSPSRGVLGAS